MIRFLHSSLVIARRDFGATVLSRAFIFFLLGPLFPLLLGGMFGSIGARVATQAQRPVIAVVWNNRDFDRLAASRVQLAQELTDAAVPQVVHYSPEPNLAAQQQRLLASGRPPVRAVLSGGLARPHLTGAIGDDPVMVGQLRLLISNARSPRASPDLIPVTNVRASNGSLANDRAVTAQIGQMLIFFLTLFLAGMVMSQLIEEKSNKIIEVIAAAVPIDAMFVGKLFAMLAASVLGILVWVGAGALFIQMIKHGGVGTLPVPAIGWPGFLALVIIYFAMNYLLIGAIMLTIGAQASTAREVQVLAMPATFGQLLVFALAATAVGSPDSTKAIAAAIFPLSSPMVMLARAAQDPQWWPHLLAILWQALWVGIILRLAAQLFRKTVLKSGPRTRWWKRKSVA
ncbi:MAG TPA: ABC transporter permease [Sphingomicrobium sp.]